MFVFLYSVCIHVRLGILETIQLLYICVVVEGIPTCKAGNFGNKPLSLFFVFVEGMCICKTGNIGNDPL